MIIIKKNGELVTISLNQFINDKQLYSFIRNQKFSINNNNLDDSLDKFISIIKKKPYK